MHGREEVARFLKAWFAVRQVIQAANFNHFHQAGLSATQFMILNLLPLEGAPISTGELATRMNLKAATIAKTVDSLEARGLLKRTKSTADRRLVLIGITETGRTFQNAAMGQFRAQVSHLFGAMPVEDRAALIQGLESLVVAADANAGERADPQARRNSRQSPER